MMPYERGKVLRALGKVTDSILETQFVMSEIEKVSLTDEKFNEAYSNLQSALDLIDKVKCIVIYNMKGE